MVARCNHPGRMLGKRIESRGRSQRQFAKLIHKSHVEVNYIIKGTKDINTDFAIRFGLVFGTSAEVWTRMQEAYDIYNASQSEKKSEYEIIKKEIRELEPA